MTERWEQRDRKRHKKNLLKQMNSFDNEVRDTEKEKELSRKRKLYRKQEEELLDVFDKKDN